MRVQCHWQIHLGNHIHVPRPHLPWVPIVEKRGGDARTEGQRACIGGGTVTRGVYGKKRLGAAKKPPMYLHKQLYVFSCLEIGNW